MPLEAGRYSRSDITGLVHGYRIVLGKKVEAPSWAQIRSVLEHRGEVDQRAFHEVMDLERALEHLATRHPQAAAVTILRMWGFEGEDFQAVLPQKANWRRLTRKSEAWIRAFLNGGDCEKAYRGVK
jgi:hypothetical protein